VAATAATPLDLSVDVYVEARADLILDFGAPYTRTVAGEAPVEVARSNLDALRAADVDLTLRTRLLDDLFSSRLALGSGPRTLVCPASTTFPHGVASTHSITRYLAGFAPGRPSRARFAPASRAARPAVVADSGGRPPARS
jgi:hypothetical protein